jgi:hypothetical protein
MRIHPGISQAPGQDAGIVRVKMRMVKPRARNGFPRVVGTPKEGTSTVIEFAERAVKRSRVREESSS